MEAIDGLVVCENYGDYFSQCAMKWKSMLRSVLVVTSNRDTVAHGIAESYGFDLFKTDVFWERGAKFNKGAAIAKAYESRTWSDWVLFFDADINPPDDLMQKISGSIHPGTLYGAHRIMEDGSVLKESEIVGAFTLFHSSDKHAQARPIVDVHWSHCGNYDSAFQGRWDGDKKVKLDVFVNHLGKPFENWCGRGNKAAMSNLWKQRHRNGGWSHEKIR